MTRPPLGQNMTGLVVWDAPDDSYDHDQLAANWDTVDGHDHTPGKGKRVPGQGLVPGSVGSEQIAPSSITSNHIVDGTIQQIDLGNGIIGINQLDPNLVNTLSPLGQTIAWFRPNTSIPVPTGWAIADGSQLTSSQHDWEGVANVTLPNLINRFVLGAATTGTGVLPTTPPVENTSGGNHSRYFSHTHSIPDHYHSVNSHTHDIPFHSHTISGDGGHNHAIHSRTNAFLPEVEFVDTNNVTRDAALQSLYIAGFNGNTNDPVDQALPASFANNGDHNHGGATAGAGGTTTGSTAHNTGSATGLSTTDSAPGGDIRPGFWGLLYITKVKNA